MERRPDETRVLVLPDDVEQDVTEFAELRGGRGSTADARARSPLRLHLARDDERLAFV